MLTSQPVNITCPAVNITCPLTCPVNTDYLSTSRDACWTNHDRIFQTLIYQWFLCVQLCVHKLHCACYMCHSNEYSFCASWFVLLSVLIRHNKCRTATSVCTNWFIGSRFDQLQSLPGNNQPWRQSVTACRQMQCLQWSHCEFSLAPMCFVVLNFQCSFLRYIFCFLAAWIIGWHRTVIFFTTLDSATFCFWEMASAFLSSVVKVGFKTWRSSYYLTSGHM